jgi:hypothetical protein
MNRRPLGEFTAENDNGVRFNQQEPILGASSVSRNREAWGQDRNRDRGGKANG